MKSSRATFLSSSPLYPVLDIDSSRHWPSSPRLDSDSIWSINGDYAAVLPEQHPLSSNVFSNQEDYISRQQ